jgi:hypothetical protein
MKNGLDLDEKQTYKDDFHEYVREKTKAMQVNLYIRSKKIFR